MGKRPNQEIGDHFYNLADLKKAKRCDAAFEILKSVEKVNEDEKLDYFIERFVNGATSSRLAARIGFSVALTELTKQFTNSKLIQIFGLIEKLPKEMSRDSLTDVIFGQILACLAICKGLKEGQISDEILDKLLAIVLNIYEKFAYLQPLCVQTILTLAPKINEEKFKEKIWPMIKSHCCCSLDNMAANNFWLIFGLRQNFAQFFTKNCPFSTFYDGNLLNEEEKMKKLSSIIVTASYTFPKIHPGILLLFERFFDKDDWLAKFWPTIFEDGILKQERKSVVIYGYQILGNCFSHIKTKEQANLIFSKSFFEILFKFLTEKSTKIRFSRQFASTFLEDLCKFLTTKSEKLEKSSIIFEILTKIVEIFLNLDQETGQKFVKNLISTLKDDEKLCQNLQKSIIRRYNESGTSEKLKILDHIFKLLSILFVNSTKFEEIRSEILQFFAEILLKNEENFDKKFIIGTFFDCIERLFDVIVKPNFTNIGIKPENLALLKNTLDNFYDLSRDHKNEDSNLHKLIKKSKKFFHKCYKNCQNEEKPIVLKGFSVLLGYFSLRTILEPLEYEKILKEIVACYEEFTNSDQNLNDKSEKLDQDSWLDVLIDLILSLLSKENRQQRIPIQVSLSLMSSELKFRHLEPILNVLNIEKTAEILGEDDESGSEFEPIFNENDGNLAENDEKMSTSDDQNEESDSASEDNDENMDENLAEVDPELNDALENTLNNANALETASVHSDLSDDTMLKLDDKLADVFRLHAKKGKVKGQNEALAFRMRCSDLLLILIHSIQNLDTLISMIVPLLNSYLNVSKSKSDQNLAHRILSLLNVLYSKKIKNFESRDQNKLMEIVRDVFSLSKTTSDLNFQKKLADSLKFLLKFIEKIENDEQKKVVENELKILIENELEDFLHNPSCLTSNSLFCIVFDKFPALFLYKLPEFASDLVDKKIRQFRRFEICIFCQQFLQKSNNLLMKEEKSIKKMKKKFLHAFRNTLLSILNDVLQLIEPENQEKDEKSAEESEILAINPKKSDHQINPRFIGAVLKVSKNLAHLKIAKIDPDSQKMVEKLNENDEKLSQILEKLSNNGIFRKEKRLNALLLMIKKEFGKMPSTFFTQLSENLGLKRPQKDENTANDEPVKKKLKI